MAPTLTEAPVVLKVATRALTLVPKGTVRAMVRAASVTMPVTGGDNPWKLKAVMALVAALTPTITITGASVSLSSDVANNFSSPVVYTVTAADASTQPYTVTVTVAASPAKAITAFSFASPAATGVIDETLHTIAVTVPYGTVVTALTPTITFTGASVSLASGLTTDFTSPVVYTVTAADSSTQAYVVTVTVAPPPSFPKAITAFAFSSPAASGVVNETLHTIAVTVPFGTDVTALAPTIAITGASVSPLSAAPQNFTSPVTYTVTAADASTQPYVVTVTVAGPAIGQSYGGGIIAYVLQPEDTGYVAGETHGLIAATVDLRGGDTLPWTNYAFAAEGVPGGTGTAIGTGADNTTWIIYQAYPGGNTFYAAYEARAYRGGGYDDWYLPSKDELSKLYDCWALGFGGFQSRFYWSSSEWETVDLARGQFFEDGGQGTLPKYQLNAVRPVRSF